MVNRGYRTAFMCAVFIIVFAPIIALAGIRDTKHNLSAASGTGPVRASTENQICIFCHTPHNSSPVKPLWNHAQSAATYTYYASATLKSYSPGGAPPIDGIAKLCLGCHDGTVAIGAVTSRRDSIQMVSIPDVVDASGKLLPGAQGYMGTDLSGHHPVSIVFDHSLQILRNSETSLLPLNWPITDLDVKLYPTQGGMGVQCTSCHEPHGAKGGPGTPPLWQKATHDEVCRVCHASL